MSSHSEDGEYTILKRGTWAHVLNEEIWRKVKSSCTLCFKRAKVYPNTISKYVVIMCHNDDSEIQVVQASDEEQAPDSHTSYGE